MVCLRVSDHENPCLQHHQHRHHQSRRRHRHQEAARQSHQLTVGLDVEYFLLPVYVLRAYRDAGAEEVLSFGVDEQDYGYLGL